MSVKTHTTKRRRYIRYAIELDATLIVEGLAPIQCQIQDFCSGGFFLGFKQSIAEISFPNHKFIKIQFSVGTEDGWESFQLDAKIMHVSANGMGVAVENIPALAFEALKQESAGASTVAIDRRKSSAEKSNQEQLIKEIKIMLDGQLPQLFASFFEACGEDLANEFVMTFKNNFEINDLIGTLKLDRESIVSEFCQSILAEADSIFDRGQRKEAETAMDSGALALVEKDEFDDWLNLSAIIRKLSNHFDLRLMQIKGKLRYVSGLPADTINNPVSPAMLCDSFREVILQFNFNNSIKQALYTIFGRTLTNSLDALYDQFDKVLTKHGAFPARTVPQVSRQPVKTTSASKPAEHPQTGQQYSHEGQADSNNQLASLLSNDDLLNLLKLAGQRDSQPVIQVSKKLLDILKETSPDEAVREDFSSDKCGSANQATSTFTADEVTDAIARIQKTVHDHYHLHQNPAALQHYLHKTLENAASGQKKLSASTINDLEVYGKFFETLFNDLTVSSEIKTHLEKIHLTLLSRVMQGDDFLGSDQHPARNLLNQLATLESAVKGNRIIKRTNIKHTLDKLINRITQEAGSNPAVFSEVEQELNEITAQVTKSVELNISRLVESYDGHQKLETARRFVQKELDKRLAGKSVPGLITMLLAAGWQHLLVIGELNLSSDNDEKSKHYRVIDDLLVWLSDRESSLDGQTDNIRQTLALIADQLSTVCTNAFWGDKIIDELTACLLGDKALSARKALPMTVVEPVFADEKVSVVPVEDHWNHQVDQLRKGEWLTILQDSGGFVPMKLIWIGDTPQIFVFVNQDGLNKLEFDKNELAELMRSGSANRMENLDVPLIDRATNMMLQKMQEKLIYNATHDPVTDLLIKNEFIKRLKSEMITQESANHMLCHIGILDFRTINNVCGIEGGNQLLKKLTQMITGHLRHEEIIARLGDKAFGILFKNCSPDQVHETAKKIINIINEFRFEWQSKSYSIGVSIGVVSFADSGFDVHRLLQQADSASIAAENSGYNRIQFFKADDKYLKRLDQLNEWIGQIDDILAGNRIFLRCQRIAAAEPEKNGHEHYEILLGVRDEAGHIIAPDNFIPAVERCQRMPEIDQWIIRQVFDWIEQNQTYFDKIDGIAINLSGQSINKEEFLEFLKGLLSTRNIPHQKLTFEITETVAAGNLLNVKEFILQIKQFGCKFSLDDFGSGYSSYAYLKSLNVDYLKIDGAFVKDIANNKADVAIVKSMNEIAHSLGMETIAEYVENNEIRDILREIGVDYVQGYGIEKPKLLTDLAIKPHFVEGYGVTENQDFATDAGNAEDSGKGDDLSIAGELNSPDDIGVVDDNDFWGF